MIDNLIQLAFSLFSDESILKLETMDKCRQDEERYIVFITLKNEQKIVLKIYANDYTNIQHINDCAKLANLYHANGIVTPLFIKSKQNSFGEQLQYNDQLYHVWVEEYVPNEMVNLNEFKLQNQTDEFLYELATLQGKMHHLAKQHQITSTNRTEWGLFDEYLVKGQADDNYENVNWLYSVLQQTEVNQDLLNSILTSYLTKRELLHDIYYELPSGMIQADLSPGNYILNVDKKIIGLYDYNLAGTDRFVSEFIQEAIFICYEAYDTESFDQAHLDFMNHRFNVYLQGYSQEYHLNELEVKAANLIYHLIRPFRWDKVKITIDKFNEGKFDEVNTRLSWMLHELTQNDIIYKDNCTKILNDRSGSLS